MSALHLYVYPAVVPFKGKELPHSKEIQAGKKRTKIKQGKTTQKIELYKKVLFFPQVHSLPDPEDLLQQTTIPICQLGLHRAPQG